MENTGCTMRRCPSLVTKSEHLSLGGTAGTGWQVSEGESEELTANQGQDHAEQLVRTAHSGPVLQHKVTHQHNNRDTAITYNICVCINSLACYAMFFCLEKHGLEQLGLEEEAALTQTKKQLYTLIQHFDCSPVATLLIGAKIISQMVEGTH